MVTAGAAGVAGAFPVGVGVAVAVMETPIGQKSEAKLAIPDLFSQLYVAGGHGKDRARLTLISVSSNIPIIETCLVSQGFLLHLSFGGLARLSSRAFFYAQGKVCGITGERHATL